MKRLSILLALLMMLFVLVSCDNTNIDTNTDTSADSQITDTNTEINDTPDKKYGNVTLTETTVSGNYYTRLNYYYVNDPNDYPIEYDSYIRIFKSLDELEKYADTEATEELFNDNYVVCIDYYRTTGTDEYENLVGFYDLKTVQGYYFISRDYYTSTGNRHELREGATTVRYIEYIIVPKTEIEYFDGTSLLDIENKEKNIVTFYHATPIDEAPIHMIGTNAYIVDREKADSLGIKVSIYEENDSYNEEVLIVYTPNPFGDLAITQCKVKDGDLYFSAETYFYQKDTAEPMKEGDCTIYEFYVNTDNLSENFQVYATVNHTYVPYIEKREKAESAPIYINHNTDVSHNYYSYIDEIEKAGEEWNIFPTEFGSYFMLINSMEVMENYFSTNEVNTSTFDNNYVMILYQHYETTYYGEKTVGYHTLVNENGEYEITEDWFVEPGEKFYPEYIQEFKVYEFLIIPKDEIQYVSGVQNITVESNRINQLNIKRVGSAKENAPSQNSGFIINKYSQILKDFGLTSPSVSYYIGDNSSVLLYFDDLVETEMILTNVEIKDGDLYLTFTTYEHIKKDYCFSGAKFYIVQTNVQELSDFFEIYITIDHIEI